MTSKRPNVEVFKEWLIKHGAEVIPETNEYELIRVKTCYGTLVAYRDKSGKETWPESLRILLDDMRAGRGRRLSPNYRARKMLNHMIERIAERDGMECFYSGERFEGAEDERITVEHMLPKAHGGSDHISNLVLATKEWNQRAGRLSVAEKVRLREEARRMPAKVHP